jgi:hypothetical protein
VAKSLRFARPVSGVVSRLVGDDLFGGLASGDVDVRDDGSG